MDVKKKELLLKSLSCTHLQPSNLPSNHENGPGAPSSAWTNPLPDPPTWIRHKAVQGLHIRPPNSAVQRVQWSQWARGSSSTWHVHARPAPLSAPTLRAWLPPSALRPSVSSCPSSPVGQTTQAFQVTSHSLKSNSK